MKAAVLHEIGSPLVLEEVPEPEAAQGRSVVDVRAAGINFADVLIRAGRYPQPPPLPAILGNEVAGDLDGRRVLGFVRTAGGVGTAAIQLAVFCGANVTAAAGSDEKRALARDLGASRTVGYEEIGELDDIDVALDPVGGPVYTACLNALRPLGVAIGIGFAGGPWEPVDPARLVGRNIGAVGFYLGRLMGFEPRLVQGEVRELLALWQRGLLRPVVGAELPLEQANAAHELIASRRSTGKVVLVP